MVEFGNVFALLALGLIPLLVLIHLRSKQKAMIPFSMVAFIPVGITTARKLSHLILLILQIIGLSFLAISWSDPKSDEIDVPKDRIIMIDVSDSMNAKTNGVTKMDLAKGQASLLVQTDSTSVDYTIVAFTNKAWVVSDTTSNKTYLLETIASLETKSESSDITSALNSILKSYPNEYITVITDGSYTDSDINGSMYLLYEANPSIDIVVVSPKIIERVQIKDIDISARDTSFDINFIIESSINQSYKDVELLVRLDDVVFYQGVFSIFLGDTLIELYDINAENSISHRIHIEIREGNVTIGEGYAVFGGERTIHVLLYEEVLRDPDYLYAALRLDDRYNVTRVFSLENSNLSLFDLIVVCDVSYSNLSLYEEEIDAYLEGGGGLLITAGSKMSTSYNSFSFFYPEYVKIETSLPLGIVSYKNTSHEVISQNDGYGVIDFSQTSFSRVVNITFLSNTSNSSISTVFSVDTIPTAVTWEYKKGKVMFVGTDLNPIVTPWNTFVTSGIESYLLFVLRSQEYLSKKTFDAQKRNCNVHETIELFVSPTASDIVITIEDPVGKIITTTSRTLTLERAGYYLINFSLSEGTRSIVVAANPTILEFDSSPHSQIDSLAQNVDRTQKKGPRDELWKIFIILTFGIVLAEWSLTHIIRG